MEKKVSIKINGKWHTCGNIKTNPYGNLSLGIRCTDELKKLVSDMAPGKWLNFSLFDDDRKEQQASEQTVSPIEDSIPF